MEMRLFYLFCLLQSVNGESAITQMKALTESDTAQFRIEVVKKLIETSEIVGHFDQSKQDDTRVFYDRSVSVKGRTFSVNEDPKGKETCSFGPMFSPKDTPVYKYKRDLSEEDGILFKKYGSHSNNFIKGLEEGDLIRIRTIVSKQDDEDESVTTTRAPGAPKTTSRKMERDTTTRAPDSSKTTNRKMKRALKTTTTYVVINQIERVFFTCDEGHFCCGLFCCSRYINSFLKETHDDSAVEKGVNYTIYKQLQFSAEPHFYENRTQMGQCQVMLFPNDYYEDKNNITSVYYRCPETDDCCDKNLCCLKPNYRTARTVIVVFGALLTIVGVAFLLYCCCFKDDSDDPSPKRDYSKGRKVDEDL